jgi:hypothetical protein
MGSFMDMVAEQDSVCRKVWFNKPKQIGRNHYIYDPTFIEVDGKLSLFFNYIESDFGLRARVIRRIQA